MRVYVCSQFVNTFRNICLTSIQYTLMGIYRVSFGQYISKLSYRSVWKQASCLVGNE